MAGEARRLDFAVSVTRDGTATSDDGPPPLEVDEAWTPEHLVLAALARCVRKSLSVHLERSGLSGTSTAEARGVVTRRPDGSWGLVEVDVAVDVSLDAAPDPTTVRELLERAQRGCFVGASLDPRPSYRWTVNGEEVA